MTKYLRAFVLFAVILLSSCGTARKSVTYNDSMIGSTEIITRWQLDSVCRHDLISNNLDDWFSSYFYDYESGAPIVKKMYIKRADDAEIFYIIMPIDTVYEFTKRITVQNNIE